MEIGGTSIAVPTLGTASSLWRHAALDRLGHLRGGTLVIEDRGEEVRLGTPADDGLAARVVVRHPRLWRRLAMGGSAAAGASYADGDWDADDVTALVRLLSRNRDALAGMEGGLALISRPATWAISTLRRNSRTGSRRNIALHYDLGNDFFALMLDPSMTYSSAVFDPPDATLEEASRAKLDLLCRKLALDSGDHLLEIGSGWGSMAIHAASRYGCRVTTATISKAQFELARERVRAAGLADRVEVVLSDYRDLEGRFDKLVSVEMIEAIGSEQYRTFFAKCASLLAPGGLLALQAITIADQHYERARRELEFIRRHIFPGSCIPSITALLAASTAASDFRMRELSDYTLHYARTLAAWRGNLEENRAELERITDERFRRLWHFYLCYCEGGFHERYIGVVQMLFARPGAR